MKEIKSFIKELKRVRWPSVSDSNKAFWKSIIFITITGLIFFLLTLGFTALWSALGVGLNG